jgi:hypothetical protein
MAHPEQKAFFSQLQLLYPQYFTQVRVGEVGSLNIKGSVREFFSDCASTGRPEHGTARTSPNLSPLTHANGWNYYRNLDADDFMNTFNLQGWFDYFHFLYCPKMFDFYFYGFRKGATQEIRVEPAQMLVALNQQMNAVRLACWAPAMGLIRG